MLTAILILLIVLSTSVGDVLITRGMKQIGEISTLAPLEMLRIAGRVLSNGYFMAGLLMMAISFFAFMGALAVADMSLVVPATSISFVFATLGARFYLQERIDRLRWAGTALVLIGVMLVSLP
jgi:drug/metabolite transporter (DMT)-like permease